MLLAVVFGAIFLTVIGSLTSFVLIDNKLQSEQTDKNRALAIAEAGIEYYRWHLAHFTGDVQNGTGAPGPYVISYNDPEGSTAGSYTLNITGNSSCNQLTSVDITSKGQPANSNTTATISARYARPTVGQYSYIVNESVYAGADRTILGPYHSNGGIHMDGNSNSPVTSSLATWSCTSSYGCAGTQTKNGVWGAGTNQNLWSYPTPQVDFSAISANFTTLKTTATASGLFFATNGTANASRGYHLIFNGNGTVTVKKVNSTLNIQSFPIDDLSASSPTTDYTVISSETLLGTYTIPSNCGLIFVEDDVWVEGTINQKVTLVAADVTHTGVSPNVNLRGNLTYSAYDGTAGLTLIAENDVLVSADSPNNMTLNGIFIAQGGAFGRNLYLNSSQSDCNSTYEPRNSLTILGTTVSNKRTGTKWVNGCASGDAGYQTRTDSYDRRISTNPPPFTPYTSTDYTFLDWRQK